jgi:transitional endoplasmic reticulum ATPase
MNIPFSSSGAMPLADTHPDFDRSLLSPAQAIAYRRLVDAVRAAPIVALTGAPGSGKTSLLRLLAQELGGVFLATEDMVTIVRQRDSLVCADSVFLAIEQAFEQADTVILDNLGMMFSFAAMGHSASGAADKILSLLRGTTKRLVMGGGQADEWLLHSVRNRVYTVKIGPLEREDYAVFLANALDAEAMAAVDLDLVWRHAAGLSGHDLQVLAGLLADAPAPTTAMVIERIDAVLLTSNVKEKEVEALSFDSLPGSEAIAAKLETHIMLPLEQPELARRLSIKPKRGVLLYGPPGTGKTSIGRALAHRMKGKFFLIDGSFVTEPPVAFFSRVTAVVREAKANAPCVLFVDDADVLFGIEHIAGFSRYLLSLLDGVESESAGRVCLMMTAMNASRIPGSIMRSGRVELWLETKLPDRDTRALILERWLDGGLPEEAALDRTELADLTEGFTPADLRRVVSDARALHAIDVMAETSPRSAQMLLGQAIADLIDLRARMAENLHDESLRITSLSTAAGPTDKKGRTAKYGAGIGGMAAACEACIVASW